MGKDVIIACDFASKEETLKFLSKFKKHKPFVKIGMELFYSEGPSIVKEIKKRGHKIFLDLKLHDIPNTIRKSMAVLSKLNVDMVNCHAGGTKAMMKAAREGLGNKTILIAVTQLTSTDQNAMNKDLLIKEDLNKVVMHYAKNAKASGLDGVVCSPLEAKKVHQVCGKNFITITPGVRFKENAKGDQKRVMTPSEAKKIGSDYIVVGRPITEAPNPIKAYERCCKEFIG
ncbi:MAG: orotidine-5'-phosphate decarboxylase [Bacilli bacterium]|nr:orotidine-5'-phosphate decarboxylase [Bacilli bacterium]